MVTIPQELSLALGGSFRLILAVVLGGALGYERQRHGKVAGVRTHMLVSLGSALFVLSALEAGAAPGDVTRVVQGIATGIGFVGAGAILKLSEQGHMHVVGLTTASTVWIAAAVGMAVGAGRFWLPVFATALCLAILVIIGRLEPQHPAPTS
jgi:putative Mg2+ transporter-C (MgtC) family protein